MADLRVSCSAEYEDIFYNESQWPVGAELCNSFLTTKMADSKCGTCTG